MIGLQLHFFVPAASLNIVEYCLQIKSSRNCVVVKDSDLNMDAIIIANSSQLRADIATLVAQHAPDIVLCGEAGSLPEALALLQLQQPELVLLATDLTDAPGLSLLEHVGIPTFETVVFSASQEWAYQSFQKQALGFSLCPINEEEFNKILDKLRKQKQDNRLLQQLQFMLRGNASPDRIVLHLYDGVHVLPLGDTVRLESEGNYTTFYTTHNERIMVTKPIGEFEHLTHNNSFFRVHQSHIINVNFVRKVLKEDGCSIVLENNVRIPLARRRKDEFFRVLGV